MATNVGEQVVMVMNKSEYISAMLDGELEYGEIKEILSAIDDQELKTWNDFCLVGDLIRSSEMIAFDSPALSNRIMSNLLNEPTVVAPVLAAKQAFQVVTKQQQIIKAGRSTQILASVAAIFFLSFVLNRTIPALDSQVQMVRTQVIQNTISDEDLALWQEYFMAHQQNSVRNGLSGLSPIARIEADRPSLDNTERMIVNNSNLGDWMNVWEQPSSSVSSVQFSYVAADR
jgi:negative regulator of sigma E activity